MEDSFLEAEEDSSSVDSGLDTMESSSAGLSGEGSSGLFIVLDESTDRVSEGSDSVELSAVEIEGKSLEDPYNCKLSGMRNSISSNRIKDIKIEYLCFPYEGNLRGEES